MSFDCRMAILVAEFYGLSSKINYLEFRNGQVMLVATCKFPHTFSKMGEFYPPRTPYFLPLSRNPLRYMVPQNVAPAGTASLVAYGSGLLPG